MPTVVSVPETIAELTALVQAGDIPAAKKLGRKLINTAETRELWLIDRIAKLLENRPRTAVDILRDWWASAPTDADRAIIEACAPKNGEQRRRPQATTGRAPRWNGRNKYQAPSTVTVGQNDELRRRRRNRQEQSDAAVFANYQAERAGVAEGEQIPDRDERTQAAQVYASGFDYDRAAVADLRTRLCVWCAGERAVIDVYTDRVKAGHGDDGLCTECRSLDRPGIPELPTGHTYADAIRARCDYHVTHSGMPAVRAEWRRAMQQHRRLTVTTIEQWANDYQNRQTTVTVADGVPRCAHCDANLNNTPNPLDVPNEHDDRNAPHDPRYCSRACADAATAPEDTPDLQPQPEQEQESEPQPEAEPNPQPQPEPERVPTVDGGSCGTCGEVKQVRQGLCLDCRRLEQETAQQQAEPTAA